VTAVTVSAVTVTLCRYRSLKHVRDVQQTKDLGRFDLWCF